MPNCHDIFIQLNIPFNNHAYASSGEHCSIENRIHDIRFFFFIFFFGGGGDKISTLMIIKDLYCNIRNLMILENMITENKGRSQIIWRHIHSP